MIRAAVIGVSGFGRVHYGDIMREHTAGRMTPVAATVINQAEEPEKCAALQAAGAVLYTDYREMLARHRGEIDLCCIPTGIALHAPMTIAALEAGANVFVEKPAAATIQDVRAMEAASEKAGRYVAVGFQSFYAPEMLPMKQAIVSGELGKVHTIKTRALWPRSRAYYTRNDWAGRLKARGQWVLDSPFNNANAHQLAQCLFLAGPTLMAPAEIRTVQAELYRANDIESADTAAIRVTTGTGITVLMLVTHAPEESRNPVVIVRGERGGIEWSFDGTTITAGGKRVYESKSGPAGASREALTRALMQRMTDPSVFVCDLAAGGAHTLAVNGCHESRRIVTIPTEHVRVSEIGEPGKTSPVKIVRGIDALIARAFSEEKLLSEVGAPWGQAAEVIDMRGYERFPRGG